MAVDEATLVALLNSAPIIDGTARDELGDTEAARRWLRIHGITAPATDWPVLRYGRNALQAVVRGEQPPSPLEPLLDGAVFRPVWSGDGVGWRLELDDDRAVAARTFVAEAVLAWDAL